MWRDSTNLLFGIMRNLNTSESLDLLVPWDSFSCLRYRKSAFLFLSPFWGESSSGCCAAGLDSSLFPPGSPTHSPLLSLFHHTCSFDILFWSSGLCNMLFIYFFFLCFFFILRSFSSHYLNALNDSDQDGERSFKWLDDAGWFVHCTRWRERTTSSNALATSDGLHLVASCC